MYNYLVCLPHGETKLDLDLTVTRPLALLISQLIHALCPNERSGEPFTPGVNTAETLGV